jgi:hypothetical protein
MDHVQRIHVAIYYAQQALGQRGFEDIPAGVGTQRMQHLGQSIIAHVQGVQ